MIRITLSSTEKHFKLLLFSVISVSSVYKKRAHNAREPLPRSK
jgi:hypothetical protein